LIEGVGAWIAKEELADFSEKIVQMLGNADVRKELGDAGRDYAHDWSASKQAKRMLDFYQTVLTKSGLHKHSLELSPAGTN